MDPPVRKAHNKVVSMGLLGRADHVSEGCRPHAKGNVVQDGCAEEDGALAHQLRSPMQTGLRANRVWGAETHKNLRAQRSRVRGGGACGVYACVAIARKPLSQRAEQRVKVEKGTGSGSGKGVPGRDGAMVVGGGYGDSPGLPQCGTGASPG